MSSTSEVRDCNEVNMVFTEICFNILNPDKILKFSNSILNWYVSLNPLKWIALKAIPLVRFPL